MQDAADIELVKEDPVPFEAVQEDPLVYEINWKNWDNFGPRWNEQSRVQNINPVSAVLGHIGPSTTAQSTSVLGS